MIKLLLVCCWIERTCEELQPGYSTPNFHILSRLQYDNFFLDLTLFLDNSFYSFHPIGLNHAGQLDYEVMLHLLF